MKPNTATDSLTRKAPTKSRVKKTRDPDVPYAPSVFFESVWKAMRKIPRGKVSTYGDLARAIQNPRAVRAVGRACNQNPDAPRTPCHRVVASDGSLGGYAGGSAKKIRLLKSEGVHVFRNRIVDFERIRHRF